MAVWLDRAEILALDVTGPAHDAVKSAASASWGAAKIADQDSKHDTSTLAGALYATFTNDAALKTKTQAALRSAIGTEAGGRTLALGRNLTSYVIAADIIGYREPAFVSWITSVRGKSLDGLTLISTHEKRGNNWGTMCGAARIAAAVYLGDRVDLEKAASVLRGWLGERAIYSGFKWGSLSWQADKTKPVGINLPGSKISGKSVDGVLPDDQRRTGDFKWPPPCGNYPHGALGPVLVALEILRRNGFPDAPSWSSSAARRALEWLNGTVDGKSPCPAKSDDAWQPYLARWLYTGVNSTGGDPKAVGKPMAWTGWTHG